MKKHSLLFLFIFFILIVTRSASCFAQNPLVKMWDKRFGGMSADDIYSLQQTKDGGYILGGHSDSDIGGDKTQPIWNNSTDGWIVKTDSLGNKQWDKDFGGTDIDFLSSIQQTVDGGYILGGASASGISGDKTQPSWGGYDYWILKTDSLGNKQWDKDFGGMNDDNLWFIQQTADGGYILGGRSASDISGNKTEPTWGGAGDLDYWIVKTDSLGNKQWDKDFGGIYAEYFSSLHQTKDGGYILGGHSFSGISGDKTQPTWGGVGDVDCWIVKTDSLGNKQWDKDFGGIDDDHLSSIQQTVDGGYILGGYSVSGISGDKTEPTWGGADYWIVKTDSLGNKQWDKDFGGTSFEQLWKISQTVDGGYLISGSSGSPISGDKTENNLGPLQTWIVKTDSLGNKQWDKTIFTLGSDFTGLALQVGYGCYVITNFAYLGSGIGGYKSQANWNNSADYWIIKFCDSTFMLPTATLTSLSNLCPGTCTDFTNLSFNATSYQWSFPGAIPPASTDVNPQNICYSTPGSYDVTLIAANANGSDTLTLSNYITVYPQPAPQSITQSGDTLFANAGAASYQWYYNANSINGATDYFYVAAQSGDYNVVATDSNGCEVEAAIFNVTVGLQSTPDSYRDDSQQLLVYPDPAEEFIVIRSDPDSYREEITANSILIYDMMGEKVSAGITQTSSNLFKRSQTVFDVSSLAPGMYLIEVTSGEKVFRTKFVKN